MKKLLTLLLAVMLIFALAACGETEPPNGSEGDTSITSQTDDGGGNNNSDDENRGGDESAQPDDTVPTTGTPLGWPDNDYTKLVPTPDCGGKVLSSGEIGTLFAIELKWSMEQGIAYARLLEEAGFGEDCAEKYEQTGYIDRTANGINVQLTDLFGVTSVSIMRVE